MIKVKFFTLLRLYLGIDEVDIEEENINISCLLNRVRDEVDNNLVIEKLLNEDGSMKQGTIILINGHDIFFMDKMDTVVNKGDIVSLFTPGAGG